MSGSTSIVNCRPDPFTRGHTHQLISRGLDDYTPSIDYHTQSFPSNDPAPSSLIYSPPGGKQGYGIYDDVPDHGGRKQMGRSNSHRLTQSYHAHHNNFTTRPHPPSTSYSYHPPTTLLNHTPLLRNNSAGYHSDDDRMQSYRGDDRGHRSYHSDERTQHVGQYGYNGDISYHRNERSYHGNERSQPSYHSNERVQRTYYSNGRSQYDDRHSNLTSSVVYSPRRPLPSTAWYSNSWSSYNKHSINPLITSSPSSLVTANSPDSSPPTTRPHTGGVPYIDIISHPEDMGVAPNTRLMLTCEARLLHNTVAPVYQWYKDEEPLVGEIESVLIKETITEEDTGFYFCIVSDVDQITQRKSRQAYVYLEEEDDYISTDPIPPVIIEQPPANITLLTGTRLHLKLLVQGVPEPIFRWFRNDMELAQFTSNELLIPCVTVREEGKYVCLIKNDFGSILSRIITVKLLSKAQRSSSDSQLESNIVHDFDDEIALPPSYTAPSSPQKLPSSLSFRPHPPTSLFSPETTPMTPPSVEIDDNMLSIVSSQLKRQVDSFRMCQLALCLGVATYELSIIKMKFKSIDEQILQVLTSWKDHTHHPTVGMLDDLLSMEGFIISLPHHFGATPTTVTHKNGAPPTIIRHPRNPHVATETVTLSITAEGEGPLNYQWYKNNIALANQTLSQLLIFQPYDSGLYHCTVINNYGKAVSHPVFVGVASNKLPPSLSQNNPKGSGGHSGNLVRKVESLYNPPVMSSLGGIPRKGSGDTLSLPSLDSMTTCTNTTREGEGGIMERFDQLKIDKGDKPVILKHPISQEIASGDPLHLSVLATTPESLKYIWYFNGLALCKETFPEFFLNCFSEDDVGDYYCEISNNYDTVKSDLAKISLQET